MPDKSQALATYRALLTKIDAKFAEIHARHAAAFRCGAGCHGCCQSGLTVSALEAGALGDYLAARPALVAALRELERADPFNGTRCKLLGADGRCTVYEARPVVCRSHGAPLVVEGRRDVCPLNFTAGGLDALPAQDFVNVETLNTLLGLLSAQYGAAPEERTPLQVDALLSGRAGS